MTISLIHPVFVFYLVYFGVFRPKYDAMLNAIKTPYRYAGSINKQLPSISMQIHFNRFPYNTFCL